MKIARIEVDGETRVGIVDGDQVQPLSVGVDEVLAADDRPALVARTADGDPRPLSAVHLLAPVQPGTLRDYITFEEHLEGSLKLLGRTAPPPEWYEQPVFYFSNTNAVIGPDEPVAVPPGCRRLDFELELAAVIGKPGRDLTPEQAADHIAGYTLFNDWSARDLMPPVIPVGLGPVKGKDFANTLGPWIVTADELAAHRRDGRLALEMHAEVNGVPLPGGGDTSASMSWSFEEIVAYASRGAELRTGDVLASGTCGAGCLLEYWAHLGDDAPPPLVPGDVVTLVVEGIGSVSNRVVAGVEPVDLPTARVGTARRPRPWTAAGAVPR
ncbi:2-keto-4-pentenoate hydratase/2-oxohepta-3-ene-1,7-dioic acid hydratase in catechol pathway [Actinomycetospora succinea]|uniref:2-keto-4-pentenoate hydratase/2-oxohepta-3-ene-1,7-dioic acid hydratase in catechol pathway n=1 Tax=Actinomycetospora succinea TaxID=663603 RepID=A0A4R6VM26_9PSEU|nr:fumarylacetoacetate hydrolase family protein [Actinomycetospora succinea]TDQ64799.1 2-keto-4-pentenoate hydratase/2-oxohepta-3-ene-1,7-dioic acid hydratase in catechol pathway [Actinomycetospora succinea]